MTWGDIFAKLRSKSKTFVLQIFTPQEFKALLIFLAIGFAILLFRGGKSLFYTLYPPAIPNEIVLREQKNDSLFAALSRKVIVEDSLKFWIPDDSLEHKDNPVSTYVNKKVLTLTAHCIAINSTDAQGLTKLPGVGAVTAERILLYRKKRGGFHTLRELMNVQGIGEKKFKEMETYLRLN